MSRLYGSMQGSARTVATRCGSRYSGISAHVRGWNVGVKVHGDARDDGSDEFRIYSTGGSSNPSAGQFLGTVALVDGVPTFTPAGS